jgi:hypothetical protein
LGSDAGGSTKPIASAVRGCEGKKQGAGAQQFEMEASFSSARGRTSFGVSVRAAKNLPPEPARVRSNYVVGSVLPPFASRWLWRNWCFRHCSEPPDPAPGFAAAIGVRRVRSEITF